MILSAACSPQRTILAPGEIPRQERLVAQEEQYGHQVFQMLADQYPISRNDAQIERVRNIVQRLTKAAGADANPWHVYLFEDDKFKNAAATRGNYIFVWSGLLRAADSEAELATVLAHEIGHVLARHTAPTPAEETNNILAGVAGEVTSQILARQGTVAIAAGLAGALVNEGIKALIINPEQQRKELEADMVGLFLMADAGYDPEAAVQFWGRVMNDPDFNSGIPAFLSSHPSTAERFTQLRTLLPHAQARFRGEAPPRFSTAPPQRTAPFPPLRESITASRSTGTERWVVQEPRTEVLVEPRASALPIAVLNRHTEVEVAELQGRWLHILSPLEGYVRSSDLAPLKSRSGTTASLHD